MPEQAITSSLPELSFWKSCFRDLFALQKLAPGWCGAGSVAPSPALIDSAIKLAAQFLSRGDGPPSSVEATPHGTITFIWSTSDGLTELEALMPGHGRTMTTTKMGRYTDNVNW